MVMRRWICGAICSGLAVISAAMLAGCDSGVSREQPQAQAPEPEAQPQPSQGFGEGGSSSLGKAKQTARNIVDQQEQRQKELADLTTPGGDGDDD